MQDEEISEKDIEEILHLSEVFFSTAGKYRRDIVVSACLTFLDRIIQLSPEEESEFFKYAVVTYSNRLMCEVENNDQLSELGKKLRHLVSSELKKDEEIH